MNKIIAASAIAIASPTIAPAIGAQLPDPIFPALAEFSEALAALYADELGDIPDGVSNRFYAAVDAVVGTQPTSPAGLAALTGRTRDQMERAHRGDASVWGTGNEDALVVTIDDAMRGMSGLQPWVPTCCCERAAQPSAVQEVTMSDLAIAAANCAMKAWKDLEVISNRHSDTENLVIDWRRQNPRPEGGPALTAWNREEKAIEKSSGHARADRDQKNACNRFSEARDNLAATRPFTVAGLRAKAGVARTAADETLQQEIAFDIGVLFGDLDKGENPIAT